METLRKLGKLAFVVIVGFCGVGCIAETDAEVAEEIDNTAYEMLDSENDGETGLPEGDDEETNEGTADDTNGVCPPPCTKI